MNIEIFLSDGRIALNSIEMIVCFSHYSTKRALGSKRFSLCSNLQTCTNSSIAII